jgi:hypothetical protein
MFVYYSLFNKFSKTEHGISACVCFCAALHITGTKYLNHLAISFLCRPKNPDGIHMSVNLQICDDMNNKTRGSSLNMF